MKVYHSVTVNNKKYPYCIEPQNLDGEEVLFVECAGAGISQPLYAEDIAQLLVDLPQWITEYQHKKKAKKAEYILFRVKPDEKLDIERKAYKSGYPNVSSFIRDKVLT